MHYTTRNPYGCQFWQIVFIARLESLPCSWSISNDIPLFRSPVDGTTLYAQAKMSPAFREAKRNPPDALLRSSPFPPTKQRNIPLHHVLVDSRLFADEGNFFISFALIVEKKQAASPPPRRRRLFAVAGVCV